MSTSVSPQLGRVRTRVSCAGCMRSVAGTLKNRGDAYGNMQEDFAFNKIPKILFKHQKSGLKCEVCVEAGNPVALCSMFKLYAAVDVHCVQLSTLFRLWAKVCCLGIQENGHYPGHIFVIMAHVCYSSQYLAPGELAWALTRLFTLSCAFFSVRSIVGLVLRKRTQSLKLTPAPFAMKVAKYSLITCVSSSEYWAETCVVVTTRCRLDFLRVWAPTGLDFLAQSCHSIVGTDSVPIPNNRLVVARFGASRM